MGFLFAILVSHDISLSVNELKAICGWVLDIVHYVSMHVVSHLIVF